MGQKQYDVEGAIALAKFLKFGYLILIIVSLLIVYILNISKYFLFIPVGFLFVMSLHILIATYFFKDHYICFMQSMKHAVMDPTIKYDKREIKAMKKDGFATGLITLVFSFIFTLLIIL
jgi:hypothetical protein